MNSSNIVEVKILEDGILCAEWPAHAPVNRYAMDDETKQRQELLNEPHALLVKLHGITFITEEAWGTISGEHFHSITTALAILFDKNSGYYEHGKLIVDLKFVDGRAVDYPVMYFDEEEAAIDWLRTVCHKN